MVSDLAGDSKDVADDNWHVDEYQLSHIVKGFELRLRGDNKDVADDAENVVERQLGHDW